MSETSVTALLDRWQAGEARAFEQLTPLIYGELRRLANAHFRKERADHTLQPTALVHEAYLKLTALERTDWTTRAHFLAAASRIMRQILVDHARRFRADKRGAGQAHVLADDHIAADGPPREITALDDALAALERLAPEKCRLIELRYFGGLTAEEIAHVMGISTATVTRRIRFAESWLSRELRG